VTVRRFYPRLLMHVMEAWVVALVVLMVQMPALGRAWSTTGDYVLLTVEVLVTWHIRDSLRDIVRDLEARRS
jgi:hypothetical protein